MSRKHQNYLFLLGLVLTALIIVIFYTNRTKELQEDVKPEKGQNVPIFLQLVNTVIPSKLGELKDEASKILKTEQDILNTPNRSILFEATDTRIIRDSLYDHTSILFLETSGGGTVQPRYLSSVESAARANPKKEIIVMLFSDTKVEPTDLMKELQEAHSNIKYQWTTADHVLNGTIVYEWYKTQLVNNPFETVTRSNIMRMVLLWKQGGVYMDLDVVSLRELRIPKNAIQGIFLITHGISNMVMAFEKGHPFLERVLKRETELIQPSSYGETGLKLIMPEFVKYAAELGTECKVAVLPEKLFLPINFLHRRDVFTPGLAETVLKEVANSMGVHWYNHYTNAHNISVDLDIAYFRLVKMYAPITFSHLNKLGYLP